MNRKIIFIKGYSKTEVELSNDRNIIQLYIDFFCSNAGGSYDFDRDIAICEEPSIEQLQQLMLIQGCDYIITVLVGHGANQEGVQVFQLSETTLIHPGQIHFQCNRQLYIIETCRNTITTNLDIPRLNNLVPKYKYGGIVKWPRTSEEAYKAYEGALVESKKGSVYLFACDLDQSAYNYFFIKTLIDVSVYLHEYYRNNVYSILEVFELTRKQVQKISKKKQTPISVSDTDFPFVVTII
ncbi:hypothetical protein LGH70_22760 [Hymenobacter sp. BT635]|uniref:Caspase family protein n=1 Tax=Hymenobacter nitidus TaxID=2880929 RepID=A0ABS8AJA6_9BACT|nr:hypothetical protein [Hymenobacter nitidus]MCB2380432.1 hypothetical protein [Hymenobacter nitidus]